MSITWKQELKSGAVRESLLLLGLFVPWHCLVEACKQYCQIHSRGSHTNENSPRVRPVNVLLVPSAGSASASASSSSSSSLKWPPSINDSAAQTQVPVSPDGLTVVAVWRYCYDRLLDNRLRHHADNWSLLHKNKEDMLLDAKLFDSLEMDHCRTLVEDGIGGSDDEVSNLLDTEHLRDHIVALLAGTPLEINSDRVPEVLTESDAGSSRNDLKGNGVNGICLTSRTYHGDSFVRGPGPVTTLKEPNTEVERGLGTLNETFSAKCPALVNGDGTGLESVPEVHEQCLVEWRGQLKFLNGETKHSINVTSIDTQADQHRLPERATTGQAVGTTASCPVQAGTKSVNWIREHPEWSLEDEAEMGCGNSMRPRVSREGGTGTDNASINQRMVLGRVQLWDVVRRVAQESGLNYRQTIAFELISERVIKSCPTLNDVSQDNDMDRSANSEPLLMYLGGEGGTGKTRVIQALMILARELSMESMFVLCAPTGAAATNIDGQTLHSVLNLPFNQGRGGTTTKFKPSKPSKRMRYWSSKRFLIIDEVSMIDQRGLYTIEQQVRLLRGSDDNERCCFGGLEVVLLCGDFCQLQPVKTGANGLKPLWWPPGRGNAEEVRGKALWFRFDTVVMLNQQMRQATDHQYHSLLNRAREGSLTVSDEALLRTRVLPSLESAITVQPDGSFPTVLVKRNAIRHTMNQVGLRNLSSSTGKSILIFPAIHGRCWVGTCQDLMAIDESAGNACGPGLFLFISGMPLVLNKNLNTEQGLVNGTVGIARHVVVTPEMQGTYKLLSQSRLHTE